MRRIFPRASDVALPVAFLGWEYAERRRRRTCPKCNVVMTTVATWTTRSTIVSRTTRRRAARTGSRPVSLLRVRRPRARRLDRLRPAPDRVREEGGAPGGVRVRGPALPAVQRRIEAARAELLQRLQPLPEVRLPHVQHKLADNSHRHRVLDWRKRDRDDVRALRVLPEALRYHSETPPAPSTVVVERVVFVWWVQRRVVWRVRRRVVERRRRRGVELAHRPGQQRRERARARVPRAPSAAIRGSAIACGLRGRFGPGAATRATPPLRAPRSPSVGALRRRCAHVHTKPRIPAPLVAVAR